MDVCENCIGTVVMVPVEHMTVAVLLVIWVQVVIPYDSPTCIRVQPRGATGP